MIHTNRFYHCEWIKGGQKMPRKTDGLKEDITYWTNLCKEIGATYVETKATLIQIWDNLVQIISLIMATIPLVRKVCLNFKKILKKKER